MHESETFGFAIARQLAEVYEFLLEPGNFSRWAFVGDVAMRHVCGRDWSVETSVGPRIIRFAERNAFGILDHAVFRFEGDVPHPTGMRVVANGAGTELIYTNFRRTGMSDAEWTSAKNWIVADLLALQSMLDAAGKVAPLHAARSVSFGIQRPWREVYEFLAKPCNFGKWAFVGDARMQQLADGDWEAETSVGRRILRFGARNDFGALDYAALRTPDDAPHPIPMRVFANGDGAELTYTFFQRPNTTVEEWTSVIDWVTADLLVLKSLLEPRPQ